MRVRDVVIMIMVIKVVSSNFVGSLINTEDGNIREDVGDPLDWESIIEIRKNDLEYGQLDDSFSQGTKEDTENPSIEFGSIPPNKSDLETFGMYVENNNNGKFLHIYWTRVQEPSGTTNMDFEFNQNVCPNDCSLNGITPTRTEDDLLIVYELARGGIVPTISILKWLTGVNGGVCEAGNSYPCWGSRMVLGVNAVGSVNTNFIFASETDGISNVGLDPFTFGEATIDLSLIFDSSKCVTFGSVYLKSRSSDSFTSALKDFIPPQSISLSNCAVVTIRKVTEPASNIEFEYITNLDTDPQISNMFSLMDGESITISNALIGTGYNVTEMMTDGWILDRIECTNSNVNVTIHDSGTILFDIASSNDVVDCTYYNEKLTGAIKIEKYRKHAESGLGELHPQSNVEFVVTNDDGYDMLVVTDENGMYCIDNLDLDREYNITEMVPDNYVPDGDISKVVYLDHVSTCDDSDNNAIVEFINVPLTSITVTVNSQVIGGTISRIECGSNVVDYEENPVLVLNDLLPDTYVCTIIVDP